ncbi:UDP-N-acetylmuramoyl-L-alanyl-D-glutamate--2,6-diaminopimelate ligase [Steroidobacter sp. S1-65]|uniref:UDP-N-acetylmuramoyl-L-alanyl-D-glutamate--2,6-diaminopimelate ligase n=1 Tax=Steroidobacter gossypii TaxID=2805490 RepID=A0ABS1X2Q6_9GAMM|nr:UDP-N-acetylmuramoyl-L-alanyl-D-glutamate--2,6-diaminopimelate ligase [Steroidobacter gossypii]MBM0107507.1 UDP-N-acetylmuramoyl-L-alanyl-D-glutamate--2,6-diaminopimelate ligase [Steroidobacter gossypii]
MNSRVDKVRVKNLRALLADSGVSSLDFVPPDLQISDLTLDSRAVRPGAAFVALPGTRTHGIGFAEQAVKAGASAILWEPSEGVAAPNLPEGVPLIAIPELTNWLGTIADWFFDAPSTGVRVVGVTGTNGKTTTAHVIADALQRLNVTSAYAGTLGYGRVGALRGGTLTTPDCITVQRQLAELRDEGVRCLGMEVSSHALDQGRVYGVRFDTAVFTNLTRDHLDYHGTLEEYGEAKAHLFRWPSLRNAIINVDDVFGRELATRVAHTCLVVFSRNGPIQLDPRWHSEKGEVKQLFARRVTAAPNGLDIEFDGSWGPATLRSRFVGDFNVENLLAVLATLLTSGVSIPQAVAALENCAPPPGRMETITAPDRPLAIVDYAHTPDALEKALLAVRKHRSGKLVCVFGCGGDRDPGKRPLMGAIAERLADRVIVTDDNPRTENGDSIVADILKGLTRPEAALVERDRALAIARAIAASDRTDVVLIAGKGHEDYQIVGTERRSFSDREQALRALRRQS